MGGVGNLLAEARRRGLRITPKGEKLEVRGPSFHRELIQKLLSHKAEILRILKEEEKVLSMPLREFARGGYILHLDSPFGKIAFVPREGLLSKARQDEVAFTARELMEIVKAHEQRGLTERDIRMLLASKKALKAQIRLIENHSGNQSKHDLQR